MRDSPRGTTAVRGASPQHRVFSPSSPNHRPLPGVGGAMREDSHRRPTSETTNTTTTDPWKVASSSPVWDGGSDSIDPFFQSTTTNKNTSTTNNNTNTNTNTNTNSLTRQSPRRHPRSSAGRIPPSPDNRISSAREPSSDPKTTTAFRGRLMEGPTKINTNNPVVVVEDVTGWVTTEPTIRNSSGGSPWASAGANNNNNDWFVTNAVSSLSVQTATTTATTAIGGTPQGHSRQTPSRWNPSSSPHHRRAVATAATGRDWPPQQDQPNTNNSNCAMASLYSPSTLFDDEGDVVDRAAATEPTTSTAAAVVAPLGSSRRPILAVAASTTATATAHTPDATTNNNTNRILVEEDGTAKRPISIHDADLLDQREKDVLNQASRKQQHQQPVILGNNNNTPLESQNSNSNSNCSNNNSMRQSRSVPLAAPQATTTMNTAREHDILQQAAAKRQQERTEATVLLNSYSASTNSETALVMNSKVKKATGGNYRNNKNAHTHQGKGIMGFFRGGVRISSI